MISTCKHLQRRQEKRAEQTDRLKPKGEWTGYGSLTWPYVNGAPPAYGMDLSYPGVTKRNVVSPYIRPDVSGQAKP